MIAWLWSHVHLPGSLLLGVLQDPCENLGILQFPGRATVGQPLSPLPAWALAVKPARLVSSSPVTWKVSSNEQPEREGSSVAANRHCCHHAVPLAHQGYHLRAGSGTMEALPNGPMQGMGAVSDPVLSGWGRGSQTPYISTETGGGCSWVAQRSPAMVQRTKVLAAGCCHGVGTPRRKGMWNWEWLHAWLL